MITDIDKNFWNNRYANNETGWDIGEISTPLKTYFDQLENTSLKILIPGCGNAYEAEYLMTKGFNNVYLLDISELALKSFKKRVPEFPSTHLINDDFFNHQEQYDLIIEQTFFCALDPRLRNTYVEKMDSLLSKNGKLVGLLFGVPLNDDTPPFGGSKEEYLNYFNAYFNIDVMENAYNSITPRAGRELFIKMTKK